MNNLAFYLSAIYYSLINSPFPGYDGRDASYWSQRIYYAATGLTMPGTVDGRDASFFIEKWYRHLIGQDYINPQGGIDIAVWLQKIWGYYTFGAGRDLLYDGRSDEFWASMILATNPTLIVVPPPTINNGSFNVNEWVALTTVVGTPTTTDPASGGLAFTIVAGNGDGKFAINASSGQITTAGLLNNATTPSYSLTIQVTDSLNRTAQATIGIAVVAYSTRVIAIANLIQYIKQNEISGTDAFDYSAAGTRDGVYSGASLNTGALGFNNDPVPVYDGINDYMNGASAAFNSAFSGLEGTVSLWVKVVPANFWSDAGVDRNFIYCRTSATGSIMHIQKSAANTISFRFRQDAGNDKSLTATFSSLAWFHVAMTWSDSANEMRAYINGVEVTGSPVADIGTWSGSPEANQPILAARTTGVGYANIQSGHEAWYTRALTLADIQSLAGL